MQEPTLMRTATGTRVTMKCDYSLKSYQTQSANWRLHFGHSATVSLTAGRVR